MSQPYIDRMLWIPTDSLDDEQLEFIKAEMTAHVQDNYMGKIKDTIKLYELRDGHIGVPRM